jgi:hypothetical protein
MNEISQFETLAPAVNNSGVRQYISLTIPAVYIYLNRFTF